MIIQSAMFELKKTVALVGMMGSGKSAIGKVISSILDVPFIDADVEIEKAAKLASAHGSKPASLSDEEWALVLTHRSRSSSARPKRTVKKALATKKTEKNERRTRTRSTAKAKDVAAEVSSNGKAPVAAG